MAGALLHKDALHETHQLLIGIFCSDIGDPNATADRPLSQVDTSAFALELKLLVSSFVRWSLQDCSYVEAWNWPAITIKDFDFCEAAVEGEI
jgi:hypothetical protein